MIVSFTAILFVSCKSECISVHMGGWRTLVRCSNGWLTIGGWRTLVRCSNGWLTVVFICCVVFDVQDSFGAKRPLMVISDAFR